MDLTSRAGGCAPGVPYAIGQTYRATGTADQDRLVARPTLAEVVLEFSVLQYATRDIFLRSVYIDYPRACPRPSRIEKSEDLMGLALERGDLVIRLMDEIWRVRGQLVGTVEALHPESALSAFHWMVLAWINIAPEPQTVAQTGRRFGHPRQSIQRVADELNAAGYIDFAENERHKRAKHMIVTEEGARLYKEWRQLQRVVSKEIAIGIDQQKMRDTIETLSKIRTNCEGVQGAIGNSGWDPSEHKPALDPEPHLSEKIDLFSADEPIHRYFSAIDRLDFAAVADCFTPTASFSVGSSGKTYRGTAEIIAYLKSAPKITSAYHVVGSQTLEIDGDDARADTFAVVNIVPGSPENGRLIVRGTRSIDRLVVERGGWRIADRRYIPLWQYRVETEDDSLLFEPSTTRKKGMRALPNRRRQRKHLASQ